MAATASSGAADQTPAESKSLELADIVGQYQYAYREAHGVTYEQAKVLTAILQCRTPALGGQRQSCPACGFQRLVFHSCRNRHCPKCQSLNKARWLEQRQQELLPMPYFHNVFTLPHQLNPLLLYCQDNKRLLLDLLFQAVADTLATFGRQELGGRLAFTLVLHTWDQLVRPHFHLHAVVGAGALSDDGSRWVSAGKEYLFPVRALSKMFRGKFVAGLRRLLGEGKLQLPASLQGLANSTSRRRWIRKLYRHGWVVYSKAPFAGPRKLWDYLGRYTHRVAISNHRLLSLQDGWVRFAYRDRNDGDRRKTTCLPAVEFLRRFLQHVLPPGFQRIRHYGILASRSKRALLAQSRLLLGQAPPAEPEKKTAWEWILLLTGDDIRKCPDCQHPLEESEIPPLPRYATFRVQHTHPSRAPPSR